MLYIAGEVRVKSDDSGLLRMPLSSTTIQEKGHLGNRILLRRAKLSSVMDGGAIF